MVAPPLHFGHFSPVKRAHVGHIESARGHLEQIVYRTILAPDVFFSIWGMLAADSFWNTMDSSVCGVARAPLNFCGGHFASSATFFPTKWSSRLLIICGRVCAKFGRVGSVQFKIDRTLQKPPFCNSNGRRHTTLFLFMAAARGRHWRVLWTV